MGYFGVSLYSRKTLLPHSGPADHPRSSDQLSQMISWGHMSHYILRPASYCNGFTARERSPKVKDVRCDELSLEMCNTSPQNIFTTKNIGPKTFSDPKNFSPLKMFLTKEGCQYPKKFRPQKFFRTQKIC